VLLITDGRFSGGTRGGAIGHVSPEAASGGPIAFVREGDMIELDIEARTLELLVDFDEFDKRREGWTPPPPSATEGVLAVYSAMVGSAAGGAVVSPENFYGEGRAQK